MSYNYKSGLYEGYIYCIENLISHKKYVGQTTVNIRWRFTQHISCANTGADTYLYRAMRLHGIENFTVYELCKEAAKSKRALQSALNNMEEFYIDELNTYTPRGYNMTSGGQVFAIQHSRQVFMVSECGDVLNLFQSIRSASEHSGIDEKVIQKACNSKSHCGGGLFWYYDDGEITIGDNIGKQHAGINNWKGHTTYVGKKVCMISEDGIKMCEFSSASAAERQLNISQAHISKCCNGKRKSAGGYRWAFCI